MAEETRIVRRTSGSLLRRLFGRVGYFPVSTGPRPRKFGTTRSPGDEIPEPPGEWRGTRPEWRLMFAHYLLGRVPEQDFFYQYEIDPATRLDFFEPPENIAIEVQGFFAHYVGYDAFQTFRDQDRRIKLESLGISVIFIDEDDAEADPVYYLQEALQGRDYSRFARGVA